MKIAAIAALLALSGCSGSGTQEEHAAGIPVSTVSMTADTLPADIYSYSFKSLLNGEEIPLSRFRGKKMLLVNTASECGYTPQYKQLEEVYKQYGDKVAVIGFPSNQFGGQEPGTNTEIAKFCELNYGVTFPMSQKVDVKGPDAHPIWKWLTQKALNGKEDSEVRWNFQKYLINERGHLLAIYTSKVVPNSGEVSDAIGQ